MKKLVIFVLIFTLITGAAETKDYAKTQIKEMKHAQKYATTKKILQNVNQNTNLQASSITFNTQPLKDPKIMKFGNYDKISSLDMDEKLKKDEQKYQEYEKQLSKKHSKYYTTQADSEDFYKVYRIAEKLIRANKLDYINWRICIYKDVENPNAYTTNANYVALSTSMVDTFANNDDALALVIGHEMGHALLGHLERKRQLLDKMVRQQKLTLMGNSLSAAAYLAMKKKYTIDSKNMEYAADVEGAKLALHAGYSLSNGSDVLAFLTTYDIDTDIKSDHPSGAKRVQNFNENIKYFPAEWKELGDYNIYKSEVLPVQLSSDRKSIVISVPSNKLNPNQYYAPETMEEVYARFGYMYYVNREFDKSLKYFEELFKLDQTNAPAYLYASYTCEQLYKTTNNARYLSLAKDYAQKAYSLDSKNKYIKEQVEAL